DQVAKFMKKYAASKSHRIQISGVGRVNTKTHQSARGELIFGLKNDKNCPVVTSFNDQHVGHQINPLAKCYDPTLRKFTLRKMLENDLDPNFSHII
ncbi:3065_t:CDS:2, partial [Gigaspora rosea]